MRRCGLESIGLVEKTEQDSVGRFEVGRERWVAFLGLRVKLFGCWNCNVSG